MPLCETVMELDFRLENQKAEFTQFLYERSGRTCGTYTGLWQEWDAENEGFGKEARDAFFATKENA